MAHICASWPEWVKLDFAKLIKSILHDESSEAQYQSFWNDRRTLFIELYFYWWNNIFLRYFQNLDGNERSWWHRIPCETVIHDVIMSAMASQITSLTIVYSIVYSGVDQRKHQSSASLAFVRGKRVSNAENVSISWRHHGISDTSIGCIVWMLFLNVRKSNPEVGASSKSCCHWYNVWNELQNFWELPSNL